jgi:hypothetical protein
MNNIVQTLEQELSTMQEQLSRQQVQLNAKTAEQERQQYTLQIQQQQHISNAELSIFEVKKGSAMDIDDEVVVPRELFPFITSSSDMQPMASKVKISSISSLMANIQSVLASNDVELLKAELLQMVNRHEVLRNSNNRLLHKMQTIRGNILVGCRTRPCTEQELAAGGKVCMDAIDDTELLCFDRYST